MRRIILFGGGDGGGFIIGPKGVKPIPPFTPKIRLQLRGLSALLNGSVLMAGESAIKMNKLLTETSNLLMAEVEGIVGPLDSELSIIYQDNDGGFTCGSTGPIRFPWPPKKKPNIEDLISKGILQREFMKIIREANKEGIAIRDILEEPAAIGEKLGIKLSDRTIEDLVQLAPSQIEKIEDPIQQEVMQLFHKALDEKDLLFELISSPYLVARKLDTNISFDAIDLILTGGKNVLTREGEIMVTGTAAVALALCTELTQVEVLDKALNIERIGRKTPNKVRF